MREKLKKNLKLLTLLSFTYQPRLGEKKEISLQGKLPNPECSECPGHPRGETKSWGLLRVGVTTSSTLEPFLACPYFEPGSRSTQDQFLKATLSPPLRGSGLQNKGDEKVSLVIKSHPASSSH